MLYFREPFKTVFSPFFSFEVDYIRISKIRKRAQHMA